VVVIVSDAKALERSTIVTWSVVVKVAVVDWLVLLSTAWGGKPKFVLLPPVPASPAARELSFPGSKSSSPVSAQLRTTEMLCGGSEEEAAAAAATVLSSLDSTREMLGMIQAPQLQRTPEFKGATSTHRDNVDRKSLSNVDRKTTWQQNRVEHRQTKKVAVSPALRPFLVNPTDSK
jgi:hypothetical protein